MSDEEQLTERITVRFTQSELSQFEKIAKREGDRKTSTFIRRILAQYLIRQGAMGKVDAAGAEIAAVKSTDSTRRRMDPHKREVIKTGFRGL